VDGGWRQFTSAPDEGYPVDLLDLSMETPENRERLLVEAVAAAHAALNFNTGPVMRALLVDFGPVRPGRLLLAAHHLIIDAVSWRILLADMTTIYRQLSNGETVALPAKTTSYQRWSQSLVDYGATVNLRDEADFWLAMHAPGAVLLPVDFEDDDNRTSSVVTVSVQLETATTESLLTGLAQLFGTRIDEVLLAALAYAVSQWTGRSSVTVDLEKHGREPLSDDIDLSRTVGWFTSIAPIRLDVPSGDSAERLKSIKEQVRMIGNRALSYGVLRYLSSDVTLRTSMAAIPTPDIAFNYLGRLADEESTTISPDDYLMAVGTARSPRARRLHKLEINSYVLNGRLTVHFDYSAALHRRATIDLLAHNYRAALEDLARLEQTVNERQMTASDFERARLSQRDFSLLIERLGRKGKGDG
jgi:non-ribosomal peptide synthase protein (TIGR01720 family)